MAAAGPLVAFVLALLMVAGTTVFHFDALERLDRAVQRRQWIRHATAVRVLALLVLVHLVEIVFYAVAYAVAGRIGLGALTSAGAPLDALAYFYFSAQTYSTLGYGDIAPVGPVRLIAGVESLNGLLLLAWSGAFLFALVQRAAEKERR